MPATQISVIIPVYNAEKYLRECLESVLSQRGIEFEVIVVNDGSTDRSSEILKEYSQKIILIEQENQGAGKARNNGIKMAKAPLIAFLDADDRYLLGHLAKIQKFAQQHQQAILFYGDVWVIDENGKRLWVQKTSPKLDFKKLLEKNSIVTSSVVARKELFEQGLKFEDLHPAEDWDLWLRAIEKGEFVYYPWIGVEYRKHPESAVQSKKLLAEEMAKKVVLRAFQRHPELTEKEKNKVWFNIYYQSLIRFLAGGFQKEARKRARLCLKYAPFKLQSWQGIFLSLVPGGIMKRGITLRRKIKKWRSR